MSIAPAVKIGGAALTAGGVPVASFAVYDSFFSLYEAEKNVLKEEVVLTVEKSPDSAASEKPTLATIKVSSGETWSCTVLGISNDDSKKSITLDDSHKDSLVTEIKNKLPTSDNQSDSAQKSDRQRNKKNLVKNCSKNRKKGEEQTDAKVVSEITVFLKEKPEETNKWTFADESLGQLFGRGFWF